MSEPGILERGRSAGSPPAAQPPGLTAGGYLRRRREAQGLTIDDVGLLYAHDARNRTAAALTIAKWESDETVASDAGLARLRFAFRFDPDIYRRLVDELAVPQLCRGCACSMFDPCDEKLRIEAGAIDATPCAWTDEDPTLCTACAPRAPAGGPDRYNDNGSPSR